VKNGSWLGWLYIALTVGLTVYGQVVLKWRMNLKGAVPNGFIPAAGFLFHTLLDAYVISTYVAALLASLTWMAAMTKFDISFAYPFMSLSFVLVLVLGAAWLGEPITGGKIAGMCLIMAGIWFSTR
jgi:multidrug transporter EmrE-like cation transporter